MRLKLLLVMAAIAVWSAPSVEAHHSFGATYDVNTQIRLEGRLLNFSLRNPHSYVHIQAPDETGKMQRWAVEWSGAGALARQGVGRETLRPGDEVVITARPSRVPGEYRLLMLTLKRPSDGLSWGTNPDETVD